MDRSKWHVDLSSNNKKPDLAAYKEAGHEGISLKATEGTGYTWFDGNDLHKQAHRLGLWVERYHWLRPEVDAKAQANYFFNAVRSLLKAGDRLMCDYETSYDYSSGQPVPDGSPRKRARALRVFMAELARLCSSLGFVVELRVYTGLWYLENKGAMQRAVRRYPVVISYYDPVDEVPNPYRLNYVAWQTTSKANVPGCPGEVDYNVSLVADPPKGSHHRKTRKKRTKPSRHRWFWFRGFWRGWRKAHPHRPVPGFVKGGGKR